jgi:acetyltransferase-like isoleucine patch superfamily enzyme
MHCIRVQDTSRTGTVAAEAHLEGVIVSKSIDPNRVPAFAGFGAHRPQPIRLRGCLVALTGLLFLAGCDISSNGDDSNKINGSIDVPAGKAPTTVTTVNGSIHVDDNAAITDATTVNGNVKLGDHAAAASLTTVNGSITLGAGAHVSGGASSVNGTLTLGDGAEILDALSNVNGNIILTAAHVGGGIKTTNGSMSINGASRVEGGILVERPSGNLLQLVQEAPRIVIGPGVTVQGAMRFEREVRLFISDKATVGTVTGATPVIYSGDAPPN